MTKNVVSKYGGTSMATPQLVAEIVKSRPEQKIIVCSAPGKSDTQDHKVTDHLINLTARHFLPDEVDKVIKRYQKITEGLDESFQAGLLNNLRHDLLGGNDMNFIISRGEYYSALAFARRIGAQFIDAAELFLFDDDGGFNRQETSSRIKSRLSGDKTFVIPGFYGASKNGEIQLFKRGGSDRTGAIIAASLNWDYENWTDIDGIMNADPNVIQSAKVVSELTYEEVREGAHGGTGALMGDSILDLEYGEFDTILKNTFNPQAPGTRIKRIREINNEQPVIALSARADLLGLTIHDLGMRDRKGYLASVLKILADNRISTEHMPAAQDAITITFHNKPGLEIENIKRQISDMLVSPSANCSIGHCGVVYLVGEQLRKLKYQHNVVINALLALEGRDIAVLAIVMHPDSPSVAVILKHDQTTDAQKILYDKFLAK